MFSRLKKHRRGSESKKRARTLLRQKASQKKALLQQGAAKINTENFKLREDLQQEKKSKIFLAKKCESLTQKVEALTQKRTGWRTYSTALSNISQLGSKMHHDGSKKVRDILRNSLPLPLTILPDSVQQLNGPLIGKGRFGTVRVGVFKKLNLKVAIKKISNMSKDDVTAEAQVTAYLSEHPAFPYCFGILNDDEIILQLFGMECVISNSKTINMCYGSLFTNSEWLVLINQLFEAVIFMHRKKILHNDIKSNNIMVDFKDMQLKVIDFGKATLTSAKPGTETWKTYNEKHRYLAYELRNIYGTKQSTITDTYSVGYLTRHIGYYQNYKELLKLGYCLSKKCPEERMKLSDGLSHLKSMSVTKRKFCFFPKDSAELSVKTI